MKEKIEILQRLIESKMFASSPAALAKVLGYKGKMALYRLAEGKVSLRTVYEVWGRLQTEFEITDSEFTLLNNIYKLTLYLQQELHSEIEKQEHMYILKMVESLIEEKYDYSERFNKDVVPFLKDLRRDEPDLYWGTLLNLYIKIKNVDPYQKNFNQLWVDWMDNLDDFFFTLYPENIKANRGVAGMKAAMLNESLVPSTWWLIYTGIIVCRSYTEQDFMRSLATTSHLIDCPSLSYWTALGTKYKEGERAWIWIQENFNTASNGCYIVYQIRAGNNIETFYVEELITFRFIEESGYDLLQILTVNKGTFYYEYEFRSDEHILYITPCSETDELLLPAAIRCVNASHSYGKDEKVWNRLIDKFVMGKGFEKLQEAARVVSQDDIYKIEDVIINRKYLVLILTESGVEKKYQLSLTAFSFLTTITPLQEIWVSKHLDDSEIYIEWPILGYAIRLSDFTQVE